MVAGVLLAPMLPGAFASSASAVKVGYYDWIKLQPVSWPYITLRDGVGGAALCWTFILLGIFGLWRQWRAGPFASAFFALCAVGSILTPMALSYHTSGGKCALRIIAFVGMFAFAGIGAAWVRSTFLRLILVFLIVHFTIHPGHRWLKHSHEPAWREAAQAALDLSSGAPIAVVPSYAVNVVRYYLPCDARNLAIGVKRAAGRTVMFDHNRMVVAAIGFEHEDGQLLSTHRHQPLPGASPLAMK